MRLINIFLHIRNLVWSKLSPLGYARYLGVRVGNNVTFYGMKPEMFSSEPWLISIGNDCYITANCQFITHDGGTLILRKEVPDLELTAPITVGNDVYIGVNCTVLPGTKIGNRCIVGACSLLKGEYPDHSVIAGVPARVIGTVEAYLEKAKQQSLHFGHLSGPEKERALKKHFNV